MWLTGICAGASVRVLRMFVNVCVCVFVFVCLCLCVCERVYVRVVVFCVFKHT